MHSTRTREAVHAAVDAFAAGLKRKLDANDHKPHWRDYSYEYLYARLQEEAKELADEVFATKDPEAAILECYDVAGFAMFTADNLQRDILARAYKGK